MNYLFPSIIYKFDDDDLITCRKNVYDLCESGGDIDDELLKQAMITYEPTDIKIIHTPTESNRDPRCFEAENLGYLINKLRSEFDLILIETGSNLKEDATLFPISIADKTIVVLEPDFANLLHTVSFKNTIEQFEDMNDGISSKINFVLNKASDKKGITAESMIKQTGINVKVQIPDDENIPLLTNNGQFFYEKNSKASESLVELAKLIYPFENELSLDNQFTKKSKKSGFLGSLFKKSK